jgi:hypothetical protein
MQVTGPREAVHGLGAWIHGGTKAREIWLRGAALPRDDLLCQEDPSDAALEISLRIVDSLLAVEEIRFK